MKRALCLCILSALLAATLHAATLTVFAAASLSDALQQLGTSYRTATGHRVRFNFGASGLLARQIEEGAPADVFFSADELRMDALGKAGLILPRTRRTVLANQLVIVVPSDTSISIRGAADLVQPAVRRIAIGDPATVPAGTYAKKFLQDVRAWPLLESKLVPVNNVRSVLSAVASDEVDAGFVYRTDAGISRRVKVAFAVPLPAGPKITYPIAVLRGSRAIAAARAFVAYVGGPNGRKIFASFGFIPQ